MANTLMIIYSLNSFLLMKYWYLKPGLKLFFNQRIHEFSNTNYELIYYIRNSYLKKHI